MYEEDMTVTERNLITCGYELLPCVNGYGYVKNYTNTNKEYASVIVSVELGYGFCNLLIESVHGGTFVRVSKPIPNSCRKDWNVMCDFLCDLFKIWKMNVLHI